MVYRDKKRHRSRKVSVANTEIAIIGSGLAALSTAVALEQQGFQSITIYERDSSFNSRREGYGLTLKYDPNGILRQLGILEACALADCPSRSHYLLSAQGEVMGYHGNAFTPSGGFGQRGNLRIPRQVVRQILFDALKVTRIEWNHKLVNVTAVTSSRALEDESVKAICEMRLDFDNQTTRYADWVIGADGIRSTVVERVLPNAPSPRSLGVRLILGLTGDMGPEMTSKLPGGKSLLYERGFYTLSEGHRLFIMPYSASSPLHPDQETRYMWQLSFAETIHDGNGSSNISPKSPKELLDEAMERCHGWHSPVPELLKSTPLSSVWSTHLYDRNPRELHDLMMKKISQQQGSASDPTFFDRVVFAGDSMHAMSCFKGQGANQALTDGLVIAKWFGLAATNGTSDVALLRRCLREIMQRTVSVVAASREAAEYWHTDAALQEKHVFAGVPQNSATALLTQLRLNHINVISAPDLDLSIRKILDDMGEGPFLQMHSSAAPQEWEDAVFRAVTRGQLATLRELSWRTNSRDYAIRDLVYENGNSCLHIAAELGHLDVSYWLATQAGCDATQRNANQHTPRELSTDRSVSELLERIDGYQSAFLVSADKYH